MEQSLKILVDGAERQSVGQHLCFSCLLSGSAEYFWECRPAAILCTWVFSVTTPLSSSCISRLSVKDEHGILANCVLGAFAFLIMIQVAWNLSGNFHGKLQQWIILTSICILAGCR
jgi:hypothetical protein